MTGYAYYMSLCLRPNPGIYLPLAGGTMQGALDMASNQLSGRKLYGARAYLNSPQSIPPTTLTLVTLDAKTHDYQGEFDTATYKYTATKPGPHLVLGGVTYSFLPDQLQCYAIITLNGASYLAVSKTQSRPITGFLMPIASDIIALLPGDFVQLTAWHNAVGPIDLQPLTDRTFMTVFYLG